MTSNSAREDDHLLSLTPHRRVERNLFMKMNLIYLIQLYFIRRNLLLPRNTSNSGYLFQCIPGAKKSRFRCPEDPLVARFAKSSPGSRLQLAVTPGAKKMMSNLDVSHTSPHGRSRGRPRGKCNELAATPAPLMSGKRKRVQAQHDGDRDMAHRREKDRRKRVQES